MRTILIMFFTSILFLSCGNEKKEEKISGAYEALRLLSYSKTYPNLDIPSDGYSKALKVHNALQAKATSRSFDNWEALGPKNTAGRTLALAVNPLADSTIYLGSASGGLWRSRSLGLGESWEYVPTLPGVLGVSSIAFAPGDSMRMFIGTGEVYNVAVTGNDAAYRATRGSYGVGILRSQDGGNSWTKSLDMAYNDKFGVQSLQVSNQDPNKIFSATTEGIYRSLDGGDSWQLVLDGVMATDVEVHSTNDNIAVAAFGNLGVGNTGLYRTIDGGETWGQLIIPDFPSQFNGKIELNSSPADPDLFYASVGNGFSMSNGATWLFRSEDGGATWLLVNETDYSRWQGWFAHDIAPHPTVRDRLMAVGIDTWMSEDGGETLIQVSSGGVTLGTPPIDAPDGDVFYSHSDHHVVLFHPTIEDLILIGNDGGLFHSINNGTIFRSANGGLQTTQFYYGCSVSHQDPNFALGGLQDNSTVIYRGSPAWTRVIGGDGSHTGINFQDDSYVYASWQNLNVRRSTDRGFSFNQNLNIKEGGDFPVFIAPYVISESNPDVMYAGTQYFYKSINNGSSWVRMNFAEPINGDPIFSIGVSPVNEDILMLATAPFNGPSQIFLSTDGGFSFSNVGSTDVPDRFVNDIVFDPIDENKVYIAIGGFDNPNLMMSSDLGENWVSLSDDLPNLPGNAVAIDPSDTNKLYFGNDLSSYFSEDGGLTWEVFQSGVEGGMIVMDLVISPADNTIMIATHGRGAYKANLAESSSSVTNVVDNTQTWTITNIAPNPVPEDELTVYIKSQYNEVLQLKLYDVHGQLLGSQQVETLASDDPVAYSIQTKNFDNTYVIVKISDGKRTSSHKILYL